MRTRVASLLVVLVCSGNVLAAPKTPSGDPGPVAEANVRICMSANIPAEVRAQSVEFHSTDRSGNTRTLTGRVFASQEAFAVQKASDSKHKQVRAVLQVDGPKDLAGAAYLVREAGVDSQDGIFFYLPSLGSVRKITGASAATSLLGTDFSYLEFKLILNSFDSMTTQLESTGEFEGRPVYVVAFRPKEPEADVGLIRGWIDQETCVPLKLDFYRGEALRKQALIRREAVKVSHYQWYPTEIDMKDLSAGSHTVLRATIVERKTPVSSDVFDVERFYKRDGH